MGLVEERPPDSPRSQRMPLEALLTIADEYQFGRDRSLDLLGSFPREAHPADYADALEKSEDPAHQELVSLLREMAIQEIESVPAARLTEHWMNVAALLRRPGFEESERGDRGG